MELQIQAVVVAVLVIQALQLLAVMEAQELLFLNILIQKQSLILAVV
jgi:hypothetical protein